MPIPTLKSLQITVSCADDRWRLGCAGSLDLASGREVVELGELLGLAGPNRVEIDLSGVDFIDTAGLHAVASTCRAVRAGGGVATVTGTGGRPVARLLDVLDVLGHPDPAGVPAR